jgi:hypothetical protein
MPYWAWKEERDWMHQVRCPTSFTDEEAKELFLGLSELDTSLRMTLDAADVDLPEVSAELRVVESLIQFYNRARHLNDQAAEGESLSFLKAAAMVSIIRLSSVKAQVASPRAKAALDRKIYELVQRFWVAHPLNKIKLPEAVHDLVRQKGLKFIRAIAAPPPAHSSKFDVGTLLGNLDPRLKDRWRGAWEALQSNNPDKVSQAASSMVEVVDQVIDTVRGTEEFKDYLESRFPMETETAIAVRNLISKLKSALHKVKHETTEQSPEVAERLIHQGEWLITLLLGK